MQEKLQQKTLLIAAAAMLALLCAFACGCASASPDTQVAATVQGEDILEKDVTEYIEKFRSNIQCNEDTNWAAYLAGRDLTSEQFREMTIQEFSSAVIVKHKAEELGITVDDSEVQGKVNEVRIALLSDSSDELWNETLEHYGTTQEGMEETYRKALLRQKVLDQVIGDVTPTDLDIKNYVEEKLLGTKTKKLKVIFSSDYTRLQKVLRTIEGGASARKAFNAAMKKVDGKVVRTKDLGWDISAELTEAMTNTIADLKKGEFNTTLMSEDGNYYLFFVDDAYSFPKKISEYKELAGSLRDSVSELAATELETSAGNVWLKQQIADETKVNEMPSGLSYDVEVKSAGSSDEGADASDASEESDRSK